jgi:hypothetical protein
MELSREQNIVLEELIAESEGRANALARDIEQAKYDITIAEGALLECRRNLEFLKRKRGVGDALTLDQVKNMLGADSVELIENRPQGE